MNPLSYYTRKRDPWTDEENKQLEHEYTTLEHTISQIGDEHLRTPGTISYQLRRLQLIQDTKLARGYEDYRNSALYHEIVSKGNEEKKERGNKRLTRLQQEDRLLQKEKRLEERELHLRLLTLAFEMQEMKRMIQDIQQQVHSIQHSLSIRP
jgi:hypothetical protein